MASSQESQPYQWDYPYAEDRDVEIRSLILFLIFLFLAFVPVFTLIFICLRWVYSLYRGTPPPTSHEPPPPPSKPRGLDLDTINALPIIMMTPGKAALETDCSICLGVFRDGEKVKVLPSCQHSYHSECIDRWLTAESSCPLCRASLPVESKLHNIPVIVTQ